MSVSESGQDARAKQGSSLALTNDTPKTDVPAGGHEDQ